MKRRSSGDQISAGRLRVDAARAIAKLREYQLADRAAWVLEAIRAAVASRATRVQLRGDATGVWLCWDGEPWDAAELPRLFDELVSPEATSERYHVRLLAAAVNSALGMEPAYVDVLAVEGDGRARRARYLPEVLVPPDDELGESPLHRLAVVDAAAPPDARRGMAIHVRRRLGAGLLSLLRRRPPRELGLARRHCGDLPVPIFVGAEELGRHLPGSDVVRLPLGGGLDGFVAVIDPDRALPKPTLEIAERGVILAAYALSLNLRRELTLQAVLPVRTFIDGPRMPTDVSRSSVHIDQPPISTALNLAFEQIPALVERLAEELGKGLEQAAASSAARGPSRLAFERARAAAFTFLRCTSQCWYWLPPAPLRILGALPLVRDATGAARPVTRPWLDFLYTGEQPLPEELAPWFRDVLWVPPGDAAALLIPPDRENPAGFHALLRAARAELRAKRRFLSTPARGARVEDPPRFRVRARIGAELAESCVPDEWFAGVSGEVIILSAPPSWSTGELRLFFEGRELERCALPSAISFTAAISAAGLSPVQRYRAAQRDAAFDRADRAMRGAVVRAIEALAVAEEGTPLPEGFERGRADERAMQARRVRAALAMIVELELPRRGPLFRARAWRDVDGGWRSLDELMSANDGAERAAGAAPVFGTVIPGAAVRLPRGRIIVEAEPEEHALLEELAPRAAIVRYDPARSPGRLTAEQLAEQLLEGGASYALAVAGRASTAAIAPAARAGLHLHHHGVLVERRRYDPQLARCLISVDGDEAVPSSDWSSLRELGVATDELRGWEKALVRAAAGALVGRRVTGLHGAGPLGLDSELGWVLIEALRFADPEDLFGAELRAELSLAPLFSVLSADGDGATAGEGWRSAVELIRRYPDSLPYVPFTSPGLAERSPAPGVEILLGDETIARMAVRLAGGREVHAAFHELQVRYARDEAARTHEARRARSAQPERNERVERVERVLPRQPSKRSTVSEVGQPSQQHPSQQQQIEDKAPPVVAAALLPAPEDQPRRDPPETVAADAAAAEPRKHSPRLVRGIGSVWHLSSGASSFTPAPTSATAPAVSEESPWSERTERADSVDPVAPVVPIAPVAPRRLDPRFGALLSLLTERLVATGVSPPRLTIRDGISAPLAAVVQGQASATITLAAEHPSLLAVAATCVAATPDHRAAVDALAAHLVTVLHLARPAAAAGPAASALPALTLLLERAREDLMR